MSGQLKNAENCGQSCHLPERYLLTLKVITFQFSPVMDSFPAASAALFSSTATKSLSRAGRAQEDQPEAIDPSESFVVPLVVDHLAAKYYEPEKSMANSACSSSAWPL